ncbi:hypothetical protein K0M31_004679 [Melipona bicolor]|uniref:Uncharacterized protein n=1 Tax=Melipona bicolor TaxID=60889 RepID=A0AA40KNS8_9HYME|nr:hypothetical protein K0M31_004679 [Melipona bicolor]
MSQVQNKNTKGRRNEEKIEQLSSELFHSSQVFSITWRGISPMSIPNIDVKVKSLFDSHRKSTFYYYHPRVQRSYKTIGSNSHVAEWPIRTSRYRTRRLLGSTELLTEDATVQA